MTPRPEFAVVAGPNGAGKSRLAPFYTREKAFDGDLLALNLRKEHPDWPNRWVSGTVAGELEKQKEAALGTHKDFAFETNFSTNLILEMIEEFRNAGYKISLFYFGLATIDDCIYRVMQRRQSGGHDVANEIIEQNFTVGIGMMQKSLHLFDNITFIDGNSDFGEIVAIYIKGSGKHEVTDHRFEWFEKYFAEEFDKLNSANQNER